MIRMVEPRCEERGDKSGVCIGGLVKPGSRHGEYRQGDVSDILQKWRSGARDVNGGELEQPWEMTSPFGTYFPKNVAVKFC